MKKIILSTFLAISCFGFANADVKINATNFPDLNFRVWVVHNVDLVNDGVLTDEEIANITEIDTYSMNFNNISDITGIEFFTDLERINITNTTESQRVCSITNVDLNHHKKLKHFTFSCASTAAPALVSLNIANLPELETVSISQANLEELELSNYSKLKSVSVTNAEIASLFLNGLENFETFKCSDSRFTSLTITNCDKLTNLNLSKNSISTLLLENLPTLEDLKCNNCKTLQRLVCSNTNSLASVDFSHCSKLEAFPDLPSNIKTVICTGASFKSKVDFAVFPNLTTLYADSCELTEADLSSCLNLVSVRLAGNHIPNLTLPPAKGFSTDSNFNQYVKLPVKRIGYELYEITMPVTFDPSRLKYYAANNWNIPPFYQANSEVSTKTFIDSSGRQRFAFIISHNFFEFDRKGAFFYQYIANPPFNNIVSEVQVGGNFNTSGIEDIATAKEVSDVRYYDLQGHESAKPFSGFNIKITNFTDGTSQSEKLIK
ncbi:MAG: hypothetical protein Q4B68_08625 [Bacteroidales bacterium]|nr:hypothetical protein [Bacteroidales bacterium]